MAAATRTQRTLTRTEKLARQYVIQRLREFRRRAKANRRGDQYSVHAAGELHGFYSGAVLLADNRTSQQACLLWDRDIKRGLVSSYGRDRERKAAHAGR